MPALERAVALAEVDDVAVPVAEDLHLDVPRAVDVLLEVDAAVLERGLGLGSRLVQPGSQRCLVAGDAHALAAAAGRRLDEHRVADRPRELQRLARRS